MNVVVVDYGGGGNLHSMVKAVARAAAELGHGHEVRVATSAADVAAAGWIVLPGQGAFADCRAALLGRAGMMAALADAVIARGRPFLGTCIGMQLLASRSLEMGTHEGFGWVPGEVVRIDPRPGVGVATANGETVWPPAGRSWWVPHYGWNELRLARAGHPVFAGIGQGAHVYFVHSYHLLPDDAAHLIADVDYGGPVVAAVGRDNLVGTQFHPEKSQAVGLRLLANFLAWRP
jgi:glutamine amidotransferase